MTTKSTDTTGTTPTLMEYLKIENEARFDLLLGKITEKEAAHRINNAQQCVAFLLWEKEFNAKAAAAAAAAAKVAAAAIKEGMICETVMQAAISPKSSTS